MRRLTIAAALLLLSALSCQSVSDEDPSQGEAESDVDPSDLPWPTEAASSTLVFPPQQGSGRHPRKALSARRKLANDGSEPGPVEIESPSLDDEGHFEFAGQRVRIEFSRRTKRPEKAKKPALSITPEVEGKVAWTSPWTLTFQAAEPFDPAQQYTVVLGELEDEWARPVADGWQATFRADPQIWLGDKLITYIPEPGKPRVVATRPWNDAEVGARPEFEVLFDQPVSVDEIESLIEVTVADEGSTLPIRLSHPAKGRFDGAKVDRRHVVLAKPVRALEPSAQIHLRTRDHGSATDEFELSNYVVAQPLSFDSLECGYDSHVCEKSDGQLRASGRRLDVVFNNPLAREKHPERHVSVSPPVRNLSVWIDSWSEDGRLKISGAFEPSSRYELTVSGLRDRYGDRLSESARFTFETTPSAASASIPQGIRFFDAAASRSLEVTTRNVERAELRLWKVSADEASWNEAHAAVSSRKLPSGDPDVRLVVEPEARENDLVTTTVDLLPHVDPGAHYLATIDLAQTAHDAPQPSYPSYSWAARPTVALFAVHDDRALAVHARATSDDLLVHVARLHGGHPIEGARFFLDGQERSKLRSDANGFVRIPLSAPVGGRVLEVEHEGVRSSVSLTRDAIRASTLVPEFTRGTDPRPDFRALVISDRGVYRPGATVHFKASVRQKVKNGLTPAAYAPLQFVVRAPSGKIVHDDTSIADDMGSVAMDWTAETTSEIGRYRAEIRPLFANEALASTEVQIAEFEPPRFTVDVEARQSGPRRLHAEVTGRYLFGATMSEAEVQWTLRRSTASLPNNPFSARGLRFSRADASDWTRTGTGALDASGVLALDQTLDVDSGGPQRFTLEARISDESHREIAGRNSVVVHPAERYVGLDLEDRWLETGSPVPLELGVVDTRGRPVEGVPITVELVRRTWKRTARPGPGGSTSYTWHTIRTKVDSCRTRSERSVTTCELVVERRGDYEVQASIDGQPGPRSTFWAWGGDSTEDPRVAQPGHELELTTDAEHYAAGDTAKIRVRNPFPEATAIFTVERGEIRRVETTRLTQAHTSFDVELEALDAPGVHATVTLLPIGAEGVDAAQWKFGAVRLPVSLDAKRLDVEVSSDQGDYEPGDRARITVQVRHGGAPVSNADVALAVVDEGVLRLTNFHAADPIGALWPSFPLDFTIGDTRRAFSRLLERSQVAGDGGGDEPGSSLVATRKNFVKTALWRPSLRTDAEGRVEVELELPDNLTRFRMMAVVLDDQGRGASVEDDFEVRKALMLVPAVPRFATLGDRFKAGVLAHNNTESALNATVTLGDERKEVELAARSRKRIDFELDFQETGTQSLVFSILDEKGVAQDVVQANVPVQGAGIETRPRLSGRFERAQEILLQIPEDVFSDARGHERVTVTVGMNLWPELGARLEFLLGYPHGCVEQTTSSTLPLLAARDILPRIGLTRWTKDMLEERAEVGLHRLASMKTSSGGLAYWPGGWIPNVYGTAYAMRAVTLATRQGLDVPSGLFEDMTEYLRNRITSFGPSEHDAEVMSAVALALSEADALEVSTSDMLYDSVERQGVFGLANLALALQGLPDQDERVQKILDAVETSFDPEGKLLQQGPERQYQYYGSIRRTRAQAALALIRLRPDSALLPKLLDTLARTSPGYTTQATAFALLALREHIVGVDEGAGETRLLLDGEPVPEDPADSPKLGPSANVYHLPLETVRGAPHRLRLESTATAPVSFLVESRWRAPLGSAHQLVATSADHGPEIHRAYSTPTGEPIDPRAIEAGQTVRVTILAELPTETVDRDRLGYLAMTDRIPAGFEPVQPDLWTVARVEGLSDVHPWYDLLRWGRVEASHIELRDDRVHLYFDRLWGSEVVGSYLIRATTPGTFIAAPTMGELMYEPNSVSYADATVFEVQG